MRPVVLDACALLAFLNREPGGELVAAWLHESAHGDRRVLTHRICIGEVYYLLLANRGQAVAEEVLADLRELPLDDSASLGFEVLRIAGSLKSEHGVPYVDAIIGAWARINDAILATTDRRGFGVAAKAGALEVKFLR